MLRLRDVSFTEEEVKDFLDYKHEQVSCLQVMKIIKGEAFVEEHMDAMLQVFKHGYFEGFNWGYQECMCESLDTDERIIA